jgi:hypothetical protein
VDTVSAVGHALVAVGALDAAVEGPVVDGLLLALEARRPEPPVPTRGPRYGRWRPRRASPAARPAPVPPRIVPVGLAIPIADGTMYVLSYLRVKSGARFYVVTVLNREWNANPPDPLDKLTATDQTGAHYRLDFSGGGTFTELAGMLTVDPAPPADPRWLDITGPATPAHRVDLTAGQELDRSIAPFPPSPGEQLLNVIAADLLVRLHEFGLDELRTLAAESDGPSSRSSLGEVVRALEAVGALSPDSPVPGQLATLYQAMGFGEHGLTAPPGQELPEPWASLLATGLRREQTAASPDGCAGAALTLPEADGKIVSVVGLHNTDGASTLHVHVSGLQPWPERIGSPETLPLIWLRDSDGRWHVTRSDGASEAEDELTMQLAVIPPLSRPDWVEMVVSGRSAEVRATVPLRWG